MKQPSNNCLEFNWTYIEFNAKWNIGRIKQDELLQAANPAIPVNLWASGPLPRLPLLHGWDARWGKTEGNFHDAKGRESRRSRITGWLTHSGSVQEAIFSENQMIGKLRNREKCTKWKDPFQPCPWIRHRADRCSYRPFRRNFPLSSSLSNFLLLYRALYIHTSYEQVEFL